MWNFLLDAVTTQETVSPDYDLDDVATEEVFSPEDQDQDEEEDPNLSSVIIAAKSQAFVNSPSAASRSDSSSLHSSTKRQAENDFDHHVGDHFVAPDVEEADEDDSSYSNRKYPVYFRNKVASKSLK